MTPAKKNPSGPKDPAAETATPTASNQGDPLAFAQDRLDELTQLQHLLIHAHQADARPDEIFAVADFGGTPHVLPIQLPGTQEFPDEQAFAEEARASWFRVQAHLAAKAVSDHVYIHGVHLFAFSPAGSRYLKALSAADHLLAVRTTDATREKEPTVDEPSADTPSTTDTPTAPASDPQQSTYRIAASVLRLNADEHVLDIVLDIVVDVSLRHSQAAALVAAIRLALREQQP